MLEANALSSMDLGKAQRDDPTLKVIIDNLQSGSKVQSSLTQTNPAVNVRYLKHLDRLFLSEDGALFRKATVIKLELRQLVIPLE